MKILTEIAYDGSAYSGWQVQRNAPSVQNTLQTAAETLLSSPCAVTGCSRTDAGVHARQYFCTLESAALDAFPLERLPGALMRLLPPDIAVYGVRRVDGGFHPRYGAVAKEYEYLLSTADPRDPFAARRVWSIAGEAPDVGRMAREAAALEGKHDFSSFCSAGGKPGDRVRTVYYCRVTSAGGAISIRICADGFLYNMVRIVAGTLYEAGIRKGSGVKEILDARARSAAGRTAPPWGLYLNRVFYDRGELEKTIEDHRA
ncbi:MAG: tRNA pseudouridine(38-40) synthase TruA [Clostridia bacterium]|nr:tRNA pseudouridine(38-40) synthase TruA [Clostridia bacterium]